MAHDHGNEYQVRIVHENGTEELSGWMNNTEQVARVMAAARRPQNKAYWLQERNVLCPDCLEREQTIFEYPMTEVPSPRCRPHDSRYLRAVG
jgi:ribosomal protein S27E